MATFFCLGVGGWRRDVLEGICKSHWVRRVGPCKLPVIFIFRPEWNPLYFVDFSHVHRLSHIECAEFPSSIHLKASFRSETHARLESLGELVRRNSAKTFCNAVEESAPLPRSGKMDAGGILRGAVAAKSAMVRKCDLAIGCDLGVSG